MKLIKRSFSLMFLFINILVLTNIYVYDKDPMNDEKLFVNYTSVNNERSKDLSMNSYFENLYENISYNDVGTCGYVSLISVMFYYDTFLIIILFQKSMRLNLQQIVGKKHY